VVLEVELAGTGGGGTRPNPVACERVGSSNDALFSLGDRVGGPEPNACEFSRSPGSRGENTRFRNLTEVREKRTGGGLLTAGGGKTKIRY